MELDPSMLSTTLTRYVRVKSVKEIRQRQEKDNILHEKWFKMVIYISPWTNQDVFQVYLSDNFFSILFEQFNQISLNYCISQFCCISLQTSTKISILQLDSCHILE